MTAPARIARYAGRVALIGVIATVLAAVAMQFEGIVAKNFALARELAASRQSVAAIRDFSREQRNTIRRLQDPRGAVPEIHDKLRLVGPHEEMIFIRGLPPASPSAADDGTAGK